MFSHAVIWSIIFPLVKSANEKKCKKGLTDKFDLCYNCNEAWKRLSCIILFALTAVSPCVIAVPSARGMVGDCLEEIIFRAGLYRLSS